MRKSLVFLALVVVLLVSTACAAAMTPTAAPVKTAEPTQAALATSAPTKAPAGSTMESPLSQPTTAPVATKAATTVVTQTAQTQRTAAPAATKAAAPTTAPTPSLTGTVWTWLETKSMNDKVLAVKNPENYTLQFTTNGNVDIKSDCNKVGGTYKVSGSQLTIQLGSTTLAACPPGSLSDEFIKELANVASCLFDKGNLMISQKMDSGIMMFAAAGAPTAAPAAPSAAPTKSPVAAAPVASPPVATMPATATLTLDTLKNMEYSLENAQGGKLTLKNGTYEATAAPGSATKVQVSLTDFVAFGDLTGDKIPEAAAVLVSNPGGSGTFYDLVVVQLKLGKPLQVATAFLGDRIKMESLTISDGLVTVKYMTHGPKQAMAETPNVPVTTVYKLVGNKLVAVPQKPTMTLKPSQVTINTRTLAKTVQKKSATDLGDLPYVAFIADGNEVIRIMPVQDVEQYLSRFSKQGDTQTGNTLNQLKDLLAAHPANPKTPLPALPAEYANNDLGCQVKYVNFAGGDGVRFVGRIAKDKTAVTNDQLFYFYQGMTSDGKYYVSIIAPMMWKGVPDSAAKVPADVQAKAQQDFAGYMKGIYDSCQAASATDMTPTLAQFDAMVRSIKISK